MGPLPTPTQFGPLQPAPRAFFARNPRRVARDLLGKVLVRKGEVPLLGRIVEVEMGEALPAAANAGDFDALVGAAVDDVLDDGVETGNITASGENADSTGGHELFIVSA